MSASDAAHHGGKRLAATAFVSAFLSTAVGLAIGSAWLLPVLNVMGVYPVYLRLILRGRLRQAAASVSFGATPKVPLGGPASIARRISKLPGPESDTKVVKFGLRYMAPPRSRRISTT